MPQHALDYRRLGMRPPGYETTSRSPVTVADTGMVARREHRDRQCEDDAARTALELARRRLELRRRRLELLHPASG